MRLERYYCTRRINKDMSSVAISGMGRKKEDENRNYLVQANLETVEMIERKVKAEREVSYSFV